VQQKCFEIVAIVFRKFKILYSLAKKDYTRSLAFFNLHHFAELWQVRIVFANAKDHNIIRSTGDSRPDTQGGHSMNVVV